MVSVNQIGLKNKRVFSPQVSQTLTNSENEMYISGFFFFFWVYFPFKSYVANIFYLEIQSYLTNSGHPKHQDEVSEATSKAGGVKSAMTDKWWLPWVWRGWNGNSCAHVPSLFLVFSLTPVCPSSPIRYFWSEMNAGILYFPTFHQENLVHC